MAELYKTNDGQIFNDRGIAQTHANKIERDRQESDARYNATLRAVFERCKEDYNQLIDGYNEQNWDKVIKYAEKLEFTLDKSSYPFKNTNFILRDDLKLIALAYRDGDYVSVFARAHWGQTPPSWIKEEALKLYPALLNSGKMVWEKKNGRTMTDADLKEEHIKHVEKEINYWLGQGGNIYRECVEEWENIFGRQMSKEDQKRITGRVFIKGSSSSSSTPSTKNAPKNGNKSGIVVSIIVGAVGAFCFLTLSGLITSILSINPNFVELPLIILGFIICFRIWRNNSNSKIIKVVILCIGCLILSNVASRILPVTEGTSTEQTNE